METFTYLHFCMLYYLDVNTLLKMKNVRTVHLMLYCYLYTCDGVYRTHKLLKQLLYLYDEFMTTGLLLYRPKLVKLYIKFILFSGMHAMVCRLPLDIPPKYLPPAWTSLPSIYLPLDIPPNNLHVFLQNTHFH